MGTAMPVALLNAIVRPVETKAPRIKTYGKLLFGTPLNAALTSLFAVAIVWAAPGIVRWAFLDAILWTPDPAACRATSGACWSFIYAKSGQILLGIYPPAERWRPTLVCVIILALLVASLRPQFWGRRLLLIWLGSMTGVTVLMSGGVLGLPTVPTSSWGGLPITLILTVFAIGTAFPLSIGLALARRSTMPAVRIVSTLFIEAIRGLPLLSLLFVASIMLPLLLPDCLLPDKFVRALVALVTPPLTGASLG